MGTNKCVACGHSNSRWWSQTTARKTGFCIAFLLLLISQVGKDEEGDDELFFGRVVCFRLTIIWKGGFQGRVHKECIRIIMSVPRVVCTVSKSAKSTEQHFKVCYSHTEEFFTVLLDPQFHPCYMNHVGRASMQNSLHLCSVCLHQWRVPQFALKYPCNLNRHLATVPGGGGGVQGGAGYNLGIATIPSKNEMMTIKKKVLICPACHFRQIVPICLSQSTKNHLEERLLDQAQVS